MRLSKKKSLDIRPKQQKNWGGIVHKAQNIALPIVVALMVNYSLVPLALALILIGKWRVFAVQPRHWLANIRTNSPDFIVALSFLTFMYKSTTVSGLFIATVLYILWLLFLKPRTETIAIGAQAFTAQLLGLNALFWFADDIPETLVVLGAWGISFLSARHFLGAFEESLSRIMSIVWALFVAQLTWLLNRWLIVYTLYKNIIVPQIVLIVGTIAYVVGSLYFLYQRDNLRKKYTRQYVISAMLVLVLIIVFSDWNAEF